MALSSKSTPISLYKRRVRVLYVLWQSLRRNDNYKNDVQECLSNLQALYDQWLTQQQTLGPRPPLSPNASALAREIDDIWRQERWGLKLPSSPPPPKEKWWLLSALLLNPEPSGLLQTLPAETRLTVAQELAAYLQWEQGYEDLDQLVKAYKQLRAALTIATNAFRPRRADQLARFAALCNNLRRNPDLLQYFPPLTILRQRWGILFPLNPNIPTLPLRAGWAVFPEPVTHHFMETRSMIEPQATITVTIGPGATNKDILAEFRKRLSSITSKLKHRRPHYGEQVQSISKIYKKIFQAHDLEREGKSQSAIAQEMSPKEFKELKNNNQSLDGTNQKYKNLIDRVAYDLERARELINNVGKFV